MSSVVSQPPPAARRWSAWIPIGIPIFLLVLAWRHIALYGVGREPDEGMEAHLFQLLMPVQLVAMVFFALSWLPRAPRWTLVMLAVQCVLVAALFATVYWIEHS
jgi:hypothetical protein